MVGGKMKNIGGDIVTFLEDKSGRVC